MRLIARRRCATHTDRPHRRGDRTANRTDGVIENSVTRKYLFLARTFETCRRTLKWSAYRGTMEVIARRSKRRFWPPMRPPAMSAVRSLSV
jgi:hypothetical protein